MWRNIFCQNYNNEKTKTFYNETEPASVNFYFLYFRMEQNCSTLQNDFMVLYNWVGCAQ